MERSPGVLLEIFAWMLNPEPDIGVGRQMENKVAAPHGVRQGLQVQRIAFNQGEGGMLFSALKNSGRPVEKLSQPMTVLPFSNNASTRLLPINPLAPVTKTVCIFRIYHLSMPRSL